MITQTFQQTNVVMIIISLVTIPAAVMLARYQARRTVWEKQIREAEREAEQSRRRLVAFVSHDLRTPLAGIQAVSEAIADGVVSRDEVRDQAKHIEQESIRFSAMVDDLFEISKINAGAVQNTAREGRPRRSFRRRDHSTSDRGRARRRCATGCAARRASSVPGSDRALVRVLSNLVGNAIAHTLEGGTVGLALGADDDGAYARVDDTGVGIDEADLPRVFDVAYRGSSGRIPRSNPSLPSGSGLGLAMAASLLKAHRGTLTARNLITGARFEVRIGPRRLVNTHFSTTDLPAHAMLTTSKFRTNRPNGSRRVSAITPSACRLPPHAPERQHTITSGNATLPIVSVTPGEWLRSSLNDPYEDKKGRGVCCGQPFPCRAWTGMAPVGAPANNAYRATRPRLPRCSRRRCGATRVHGNLPERQPIPPGPPSVTCRYSDRPTRHGTCLQVRQPRLTTSGRSRNCSGLAALRARRGGYSRRRRCRVL